MQVPYIVPDETPDWSFDSIWCGLCDKVHQYIIEGVEDRSIGLHGSSDPDKSQYVLDMAATGLLLDAHLAEAHSGR